MDEMKDGLSPQYIYKCYKTLKERNAPLDHWFCEEVIDYGAENFVCELCGCKNVRYIHVMRHSDYPDQIQVGCICAGIMEGDMIAAKKRDREARLRSRRKENYLKRKWKADGPDRWSLRYKGRKAVIERDSFRGHDFYKIDINGDQYQWKENRRMETFLKAQHYVFDLTDAEILADKEQNDRHDK